MPKIYILIGSNSGAREENLMLATEKIKDSNIKIIASSSVYESEPWGFEASTAFLNQVLEGETALSPHKTLEKFLSIEREMGRIRSQTPGYASRLIDIDILFYDKLVIQSENLTIPHPHLHKRRFTLVPLVEIAADFIHPVLQKTNNQLLTACGDEGRVYFFTGKG